MTPDTITESDRLLLARLTARERELERAVLELRRLIQDHFTATYALAAGDMIEDDGRIVRASQEAES